MASLHPRLNPFHEVNFRSGDMVYILVGKELPTGGQADLHAENFSIDRAFWKPSSPILAAANKTSLRTGHPVLGNITPDRFNKYLNYVAYGNIFLTDADRPYWTLTALFRDGEIMKDGKFQAVIIGVAIARFNAPTASGEPELPNGAAIMAASPGPMKELYIDMWAKKGTDQGMQVMLSEVQSLVRKSVERALRAALVRNRDRKIDHYDEEEKKFFNPGSEIEGPPVKKQRTE